MKRNGKKLFGSLRKTGDGIKQLSDESLDAAVGGASQRVGNYVLSGHIGKYDGVIGNWYCLYEDGTDMWYEGTLLESYEQDFFLWITRRVHVFMIYKEKGVRVPCAYEFKITGDHFSMYEHAEQIE